MVDDDVISITSIRDNGTDLIADATSGSSNSVSMTSSSSKRRIEGEKPRMNFISS